MAWIKKEADRLAELCGVFWLPGGCIAVLDVVEITNPNKQDLLDCPEGYRYKWAVLAPGEPPKLRGARMAGIDNASDAAVRAEIQKNKSGPKHLAHRHWPDWTSGQGDQFPLCGKGKQLPQAPASPAEFWNQCMACLEHALTEVGFSMPSHKDLLDGRMTEDELMQMEQVWSKGSAPAP